MSRNPFKKASNPALSQAVERDPLFGLSEDFPRLVEVDVNKIDPNPDQPRKTFDSETLDELAASIGRLGLKQPIGLQQADGGRYIVVFGARRLEAVRRLGHATVFGVLTTGDTAEIALIENIQRVDLTPFEEADAYQKLVERHGYTHAALAGIVHKSRPMVTKYLGLRNLPDRVREEYAEVHAPLRLLFQIASAPEDQRLPQWDSYVATVRARLSKDAEPATEEGEAPRSQGGASTAPSAFPLRVARAVDRVRVSLDAFRRKPAPLQDADREALEEIRRHIDEILGARTPSKD